MTNQDNNMHIAYITMQFPAPSETFAATDVKAVKQQGQKVSVLTMRPGHQDHNQMIRDRELDHIPIYSCNTIDYIKHAFLSLTQPRLLAKLMGWLANAKYASLSQRFKCIALIPSAFFVVHQLEKIKPHVIHLFWGHFPSVAGYLAYEKISSSKITMFLGAYDIEMKLGISSKMALKTQRVFTHCTHNIDALENMGILPDKISVIYRGIDTALFKTIHRNENLKGHPIIVTASRLIKEKGIENSLKVVCALKKKYTKIQYYIAGEGPEKERLMDLSRQLGLTDNMVFTGHIPHHRIVELLKGAQIFLLLSQYKGERLPNVIKEAMYCKCIPATTNTPGIDELIAHQKEGLIVSPDNPRRIAEEIAEILEDKNTLQTMQQKGREKIERSFDSQKQMAAYIDHWRHLT